jgi:hypothetical protein
MRRLGQIVPPIGIALSLALAPALAFAGQTQGSNGMGSNGMGSADTAGSAAPLQATPSVMQPGSAASTEGPVNAHKFRADLQKAGYRDIRFVTTAYVVQADTQSGYTVVMEVNPAEAMSGSSTPDSGSAAHNQPAAGQDAVTQQLQGSGFRNVHVLKAAYVIRATTPRGEHISMTVSPDAPVTAAQ